MPLVNRPPWVMLLPVGSTAPTALMSPLSDHSVKSAGDVVNCCVLPPCAIDNVAGTRVIAMFELSFTYFLGVAAGAAHCQRREVARQTKKAQLKKLDLRTLNTL